MTTLISRTRRALTAARRGRPALETPMCGHGADLTAEQVRISRPL